MIHDPCHYYQARGEVGSEKCLRRVRVSEKSSLVNSQLSTLKFQVSSLTDISNESVKIEKMVDVGTLQRPTVKSSSGDRAVT